MTSPVDVFEAAIRVKLMYRSIINSWLETRKKSRKKAVHKLRSAQRGGVESGVTLCSWGGVGYKPELHNTLTLLNKMCPAPFHHLRMSFIHSSVKQEAIFIE